MKSALLNYEVLTSTAKGIIMKRTTSIWARVTVATMLTTSLASAGLLTTWDASSGLLPSEVGQPWTLVDSASPENPTLGGGVLSLSTSLSSEKMHYIQSGASMDTSGSFFMEFTMRYVSGSSFHPARAPATVAFTTIPNMGNMLWIDQDEIFFNDGNQIKGSSALIDTDGSFHTYRIEVSAGGSLDVFYDGGASSILSGSTYLSAPDHSSIPRILWGDTTDLAFGTSEWSSLSHNAMIPEPMTLGFLIPGVIALRVLRKRF